MSTSTKLRETHKKIGGGRGIFGEDAKILEKRLSDAVRYDLLQHLEILFPNVEFVWNSKIDKKDIAKNIDKFNWNPCSKAPFIKPDGGVLYAKINGKSYPILVSEAKKQGTNDKLIADGKKKQAKGNAIERAVKNHCELKLYFRPFDFYAYVIFASGCDFTKDSSINDRLDSMTEYSPRNQEYIFDPNKLATVWIREKSWTSAEILDKIKSASVQVVTHIIKSN